MFKKVSKGSASNLKFLFLTLFLAGSAQAGLKATLPVQGEFLFIAMGGREMIFPASQLEIDLDDHNLISRVEGITDQPPSRMIFQSPSFDETTLPSIEGNKMTYSLDEWLGEPENDTIRRPGDIAGIDADRAETLALLLGGKPPTMVKQIRTTVFTVLLNSDKTQIVDAQYCVYKTAKDAAPVVLVCAAGSKNWTNQAPSISAKSKAWLDSSDQ